MRTILFAIYLMICSSGYGQQDDRISTIDFVQILDDNEDEAKFYFQNNWEILRNMAVKMGYIHSYQVLEVPLGEDEPFQLMFITTYLNEEQYELREDHFVELIEQKGALRLMNDKQPGEFRKSLFSKEGVRHWK